MAGFDLTPEQYDLLFREGMRSPTQGSISDRLRPPYLSPLAGMAAVNAPASRDLEVGYGNLPPEYQALLQAAPPRDVNVGEMPDFMRQLGALGLNIGGTDDPAIFLSPESGAHELVHELGVREGNVPFPWNQTRDEALARIVTGQEPAWEQFDLGDAMSAFTLDAANRARGRALMGGGLESLLQ